MDRTKNISNITISGFLQSYYVTSSLFVVALMVNMLLTLSIYLLLDTLLVLRPLTLVGLTSLFSVLIRLRVSLVGSQTLCQFSCSDSCNMCQYDSCRGKFLPLFLQFYFVTSYILKMEHFCFMLLVETTSINSSAGRNCVFSGDNRESF